MKSSILDLLNSANKLFSVYGDLFTGLFAFCAVVAAFYGAWVWANRFEKIITHTRNAMTFAYYSDLDRLYAEILRLAIDKPHLRSPAPIVSDSEVLSRGYTPYPNSNSGADDLADRNLQYEAYAFMVWNFIETIRDRCADNEDLKGTWGPVVGAENAVHRGWFLAQIRKEELRARDATLKGITYVAADKFCVGFQCFVVNQEWQQVNGKYGKWLYGDKFKDARAFRKSIPCLDSI